MVLVDAEVVQGTSGVPERRGIGCRWKTGVLPVPTAEWKAGK